MSTETILCPAQTYKGSRYEEPEYCFREVESYGDLCEVHDAIDRSDEDYENYLESLRKDA